MSTPLAPRPLFGGAFTMPLPPSYIDASDLRQIPDTQEVFLSDTHSDTSVIIEILAPVEDDGAVDDLWKAVHYHFVSIAHDNTAITSQVLTPPPPTRIPVVPETAESVGTLSTPSPITLEGTQVINKFTHDPLGRPRAGHEGDSPDTVWIGLALWRCFADVVTPDGEVIKKRADVVASVNVKISEEGGEREREAVKAWWGEAVRGFVVADWDVFGDEE